MASDTVFVDALPYIDKEYDDPRTQEVVHGLIEEEMARFRPKEYLRDRAIGHYNLAFKKGSILAAELARVSKGVPMAALDQTRYEVRAPDGAKAEDLGAWRDAVRNAKAQLGHQYNRQLNLELLGNYGANAWLHHNKALAGMESNMVATGKRLRDEADNINAQRQEAQTGLGQKLWHLDRQRVETADKNLQIALANAALQQQLKKYKET
ncbi:Pre-mRNA-splicing factor SPF27 [Tribonema minus]|uniref:Pre-mRNA-splicing factor SPF27 n=1 Tax=Tribonema minus TaxID=303371 RepID=A0A835YMV2_9STRA|nr:Pre-mRNA-splicing factor SPF27 [Tribonema minus]|eukprot:TRINITY_DN3889_c0_g1_i1.p1 TRINITY_DN3889_c0_g1~~TRINITY_DN3889_c0_g1_i1.p1  ORF type:complete len:209 (+),score=42.68 TRINITY_DN3889_c0_g1_i1:148-774(+)